MSFEDDFREQLDDLAGEAPPTGAAWQAIEERASGKGSPTVPRVLAVAAAVVVVALIGALLFRSGDSDETEGLAILGSPDESSTTTDPVPSTTGTVPPPATALEVPPTSTDSVPTPSDPATDPPTSTIPEIPPRLDPEGNVTLFVSNQSLAIDPADLTVEIDGIQVVSQDFEVGTQHNFVPFQLSLTPGTHTVIGRHDSGVTSQQTFEVTEVKYLAVFFTGDTDEPFSFIAQDEPLEFL